VKSTGRLGKDRNGQLLLVTGVVLTLMLLVLATLKVNSANTINIPTHKPDAGFIEINDISINFRKAIIYLSEDHSSSLPGKEAIVRAFDELREEYNELLADYGIIFSANRGTVSSRSSVYSMDFTVTLVYLTDGETSSLSRNMHLEISL